MTKSATRSAKPTGDAPRPRRRLTAEARKALILAAARRAFTETGDMNGTTIKVIAEHSGISEGVIYRHFESKDQLFFEAVVEPLKKAVDDLVAATAVVDRDEPPWFIPPEPAAVGTYLPRSQHGPAARGRAWCKRASRSADTWP